METIGTWWMWAGFVGVWLIAKFHWLLYVFGAFLLFTGIKMILIDVFKIPVLVSLTVVAAIIATSVVLSLRKDARQRTRRGPAVPDAPMI